VLANVGCFGMLDVMARNDERAARQEANRQALRERWHRAEVTPVRSYGVKWLPELGSNQRPTD